MNLLCRQVICVAIFNKMGAEVSLTDTDIAHRVKSRNPSNRPKPIICKFIRRLAREEVMKRRTAVPLVQPREIGLSDAVVLTNAKIVDHLTPSARELFAVAKSLNLSRNNISSATAGRSTELYISGDQKVAAH